MKPELATDGTTEVEEYVVVWFPPEGDRAKAFATEARARKFAASEDVTEWNPLLEHRITIHTVVSELLPL